MANPDNIQHFRNLISLSAADGKIEEVERVALSKIAFERGIPLDRLNVMFRHAHEYKYLIPQNQNEKRKQLEEMIDFAFVDGVFAPAEHDLIMMVAQKLGFSHEELEKMIAAKSAAKN